MSGSRRWSVAALSVVGVLSLVVPASAQAAPSPGAAPAAGTSPAAAGRQAKAADDLGKRLGGAKVAADGPGGLVTFIGSAPGKTLTGAKGSVRASAKGLIDEAADAIGTSPGSLNPVATTASQSGGHVVRYQQTYQGIPVFGGEVTVQLDAAGATRSLVSDVSADPADEITPAISSADATAAALAVTDKTYPGHGALSAASPKLWIYDPAVIGASGLPGARLVWRTEVKAPEGEPIREIVLVDADNGGIALHFNQIAEAKDRKVCDANNVAGAADRCGSGLPVIRNEGGAAVALAEANTAYDYAGNTYDFYFSRFGRDSLNDAGMALYSTVRHCEVGATCPYANAFWSGAQMHYGETYAGADDVVGHELSHGVTEFSSNLFYYYQSGAINEALSDIFGEFMDLTNGAGNDSAGVRWLLGEDLPIGAIRNMSNPPAFGDPDRMRSPNYYGAATDSGGVHTNSGVANKAAVLTTDGGTFNGVTVAGIGIDKAALIWYEAATGFLTSGSDYQVLDLGLVQACNNLVGTAGITAGNCTQVSLATDATEMQLSPTVTGATAEAPVCAAGQSPTYLFSDNVEAAGTWAVSSNVWSIVNGYATSGTKSFQGQDQATTQNQTLRMTANVAIPAGATAYARFNHAFDFENGGYDGGQVEYSTNSGGAWNNAGALITDNGYTGTLNSGNPLGAVPAFINRSLGYTSSRLDLSSAAGGNVRLGFRVASDSSVGALGWLIDDVQIYTCSAAPALLRVTTSPALPAVISVDGIERDSWGINWATFPAGSHEVCFGEVLGWAKPACQTVNMTAGNTSTVTGTYTQRGYLRVLTSPAVASTVTVDGVPRNDWGLWAEVAPGTYNVCFGNVAGFNVPACRDVVVSAGSTATTTGTFTANAAAPGPAGTFGFLRATTSPAQAAMISVDGTWANNWGLDWVKLPTGNHQVCFGKAPDVTEPDLCSLVNITNGATSTVTGTYFPKGFLRVLTSPSVQGTITVNGQVANAYGMWTAKAPGTYNVCFGSVAGYTSPPCQLMVSVNAAQTTTITGTYTPLP